MSQRLSTSSRDSLYLTDTTTLLLTCMPSRPGSGGQQLHSAEVGVIFLSDASCMHALQATSTHAFEASRRLAGTLTPAMYVPKILGLVTFAPVVPRSRYTDEIISASIFM
ncbi:hypothetical protein Z517_01507 [Fonsecaea pedrosoi CBS 271.37]|uniref:Unplaced genomic scaffold supercont1.1, whole genome shotgun sequence n=1 Tax=Fonsecaea pedrosoi CBS 271.37 TaxID=1442368 RepID=A0A0D2GYJ3_9EURO|nr:uncharacterized protein Z517_01507 [Fonsecaea pedrosoi CBS 271.37]KIW86113.1 hypothetical protein Z517_01507 [Fonsecaea pedrosoi CBS 271.37]